MKKLREKLDIMYKTTAKDNKNLKENINEISDEVKK